MRTAAVIKAELDAEAAKQEEANTHSYDVASPLSSSGHDNGNEHSHTRTNTGDTDESYGANSMFSLVSEASTAISTPSASAFLGLPPNNCQLAILPLTVLIY